MELATKERERVGLIAARAMDNMIEVWIRKFLTASYLHTLFVLVPGQPPAYAWALTEVGDLAQNCIKRYG
jgi:hypothetical protein